MNISEKIAKLDKLAEGLNKKGVTIGRVGKNEDIKKKLEVEFIPTASLNVNAAMGGGFPKGRTTVVTGESDSGKTFICLETIGRAMQENPDFIAGWLESEKSLNIKDLEIFGIDPDRFYYYEVERSGAAEKALDIAESVIGSGAVDMYVVNSLKCLTPSEELTKSFESMQVGLQARMNSKMMRKLTMPVSETNTALVLVQHLTTQIGGMIFGDWTA